MPDYKLGDLYPSVQVPAPCLKVARLILQDLSVMQFGDVSSLPDDADLLEVLHSISRHLSDIPEYQKAQDMRLQKDLAISRASHLGGHP